MADADTPVVAAAGSTAVVQRGFSGPAPGTGLFVALSGMSRCCFKGLCKLF